MNGYVPSAATVVLRGTPVAGSVDEVEAASAYASDVELDAWQYGLNVESAANRLRGESSFAVEAITAKLDGAVSPGAATLVQSAVDAKGAFDSYAAEVDRIHSSATSLQSDVDAHLQSIRSSMAAIEAIAQEIRVTVSYAWDVGPPGTMPEPQLGRESDDLSSGEQDVAKQAMRSLYDHEWVLAAIRWNTAIIDIGTAEQRWQTLIDDRRDAEHRLVMALAGTSLGQLITLGTGGGGNRKATVALAISGELRGEPAASIELSTTHVLLERLIGTTDGQHIWDNPPSPEKVAEHWATLEEEEQARLIEEVPWVIGNLPGLPFAVRDQANRVSLQYYITRQDALSSQNRAAIEEIMRVVEADNGRPPVSVVALNLNGAVPRAAVGYGDLDHAANLTWEVPGMFNDVPQGLPGWNTASRNLYAEQERLLRERGRVSEGTGLVVFLEYDTPHLGTVLSTDTANLAAGRLAAELDGTHGARNAGTPLPNLGVLGHSYGTTVAATALRKTEHAVSSFTMIGSAGLDAEEVTSFTKLSVERDPDGVPKIYTTMASQDVLAPIGSNLSGRIQPNPEAAWFAQSSLGGAYSFSSEGYGDLAPTTGHSIVQGDGQGYLDKRTQSLNSVAVLSLEMPELVTGGLTVTEQREPTLLEQGQGPPAIGWKR